MYVLKMWKWMREHAEELLTGPLLQSVQRNLHERTARRLKASNLNTDEIALHSHLYAILIFFNERDLRKHLVRPCIFSRGGKGIPQRGNMLMILKNQNLQFVHHKKKKNSHYRIKMKTWDIWWCWGWWWCDLGLVPTPFLRWPGCSASVLGLRFNRCWTNITRRIIHSSHISLICRPTSTGPDTFHVRS